MSYKDPFDYYAKEGLLSAIQNGSLTLYNYTNETVWTGQWHHHTLTARGLVLDDTGRVIFRCIPKFFNLNERPETHIEAMPNETPELADKLDGSMVGVFFDPYTSRWRAITRGSWDNVQTQFAYKWLEINSSKLDKDFSYTFEVTAPWNRVVLAYPDERMTLIGIIHTESTEDWSYSRIAEFAADRGLLSVPFWNRPINEIDLEDPSVLNQEGYVARFSNGFRVKLKFSQYMHLHKILTGLSVKGIWESLSTNTQITLDRVPDEFMDWFDEQKCRFQDEYRKYEGEARQIFESTPKCESRKEYAAYFTKHGWLTPVLFNMLDGHDYSGIIWKRIRPVGHKVFKVDQQ